jgi:predicted kinase
MLPEQAVQPIRPEYPGSERAEPAAPQRAPRAQTPAAQPRQPQPANPAPANVPADQQRPRRPRRRRGRGGSQPQPAVAAAVTPAASTLAERLPEAAEVVPHSAPAQSPAATASRFAPEISPPTVEPAAKAPKGVVVLAIGLPGSGKSTWFKRRGVTPLSSDLLRTVLFDDITEQRYQHLVFSTLRSILRARMIARMPWNYLDATNLSPKERRTWIQMAREFGYEVHGVFFDVPLEVCLDRNRRRQRMVREEIMRNMAAKLRPPSFDEGFSRITVVRVKATEETQPEASF